MKRCRNTQYFWQTARPRDATFKARVRAVGGVVAIELHTEQFLTGSAHGIPATQFLNWELGRGRVMALDEALIPGRRAEYVAALRGPTPNGCRATPRARRDPAATTRCGRSRRTTTTR